MESVSSQLKAIRESILSISKHQEQKQTALMQFTDERQTLQTKLSTLKDERRAIEQKKSAQVQLEARIQELSEKAQSFLQQSHEVCLIFSLPAPFSEF